MGFPTSDYARKCYDEYQDNAMFYYGGSSGEHIPEEIVVELKELKKALKN